MSTKKRVGILTGGGDCPGLNPAIRAVVNKALTENYEVVGIKDGWRGMIQAEDALFTPLDAKDVRHIDRLGGTILGTSRTNPLRMEGGVKSVQQRFLQLGLDALVTIGGEDTLLVSHKLASEHALPIVGIPKTIDRDLSGTDYTLGFESALQVITESVDILRSTAESHKRIFIVEIMGRHAGHLALRGGISAGADIILIPECPFDCSKVAQLLLERKQQGARYSIVCVAEGAKSVGADETLQSQEKDAFGHVRLGGVADWLAKELENTAQLESRAVNLSHLQRGGAPVAYDRRMGFYLGTAAMEAVVQRQFGMMAALKSGRIVLSSLREATERLRTVNVGHAYDVDRYCAKGSILGTISAVGSDV